MRAAAAALLALSILLAPLPSRCESSLTGHIIVLDPGHGTANFYGKVINPGRENNSGHKEHKLALEIATRLGALLEKEGAQVYYTRTWDDYWRQSYGTVEDN